MWRDHTHGRIDLGDQFLEYKWLHPTAAGRPTLMLLHEGLGCVAIWKGFPERLAEATGCGVFVYSRAGYGKSSPVTVPRPLTYMHHEGLDVLPRLLAHLGLGDVVLVGHSDGASISLIHAGGTPAETVRGVVAMAPHVMNEEVCVASIRLARTAYQTGDLRSRLLPLHHDNVDCAFWGWNHAWLDPDFMRWNLEEYLPGIRVPLMVIQGRDDEYGSSVQYESIRAKAGAGAEVVLLDHCRHSPHKDQPEAVLAAITRYVVSISVASPFETLRSSG
ncbi:alpha/beta fold hydrolase [Magnetospirillum sp. SS-4]|uniref:alpha/beta fold hydrolase n=1 Tax=Magnetospirillum sp. SS-4 TaxID=2681465 RepID=UPI00137D7281|nr:alpha/beta hydrolase [Magnetospirillum sp. SS-4]CAA7627473.1 Predicted hydrolase or acyltransferase [Magnetospirillum sp. SS-4]